VAHKDRAAARAWPTILAHAGYGLERSPRREQLAASNHERHRQDRAAAGESEAANPLLVPWQQLSEQQRELSRSSADHISVKLATIGYRIVPAPSNAPILTFTESELDLLAQLEHDRWCQERLAHGWRHGANRDDNAKIHPDLVPWPELPEPRRRIDRDHVNAIPQLLSEIGLRAILDRKREAAA
jgi:RyR domain